MNTGRRDRGVTLLELLVTITIMGLAFAAVFGGLGLFLKTESVQRSNARIDSDLRTYGEQLMAQPYVDCATAGSYGSVVPPAGYAASVTVAYWDGNLPAAFGGSCTTDLGVQQLTVVLATPDGVSGTLTVGKSR